MPPARVLFPVILSALALNAGCGGQEKSSSGSRTSPRSVRITMAELHQRGGVPPGWQPTLRTGDVAAGRRSFEELGCPSCHKVAGEKFSEQPPSGPGPELTGMGGHHPPAYFFESIVNPDAVVVEGPGWVSDQGRSNMPVYPDLTVTQVEDLVAYVSSLTAGGPTHVMPPPDAAGALGAADRPAPPATAAHAFFEQSYDVVPGKVTEFETWFRSEGAKRFLAVDGLVGIDTFVDATRPGQVVTSVFGFRDDASLLAFANTQDPAIIAVGTEFDAFVGAHDHKLSHTPLTYRAPGLSVP